MENIDGKKMRTAMNEIVFTPAAVLDMLRQIEELKDKDISLSDTPGSSIEITIGESTYTVDTASATPIEVSEEVVEDIADVNADTYTELASDDVVVEDIEEVKSGILKEIAKTLAVGGLVRLTSKLLGKDIAK